MERNNTLYVRTFGTFSMTWNGKPIAGGAKSSESQFTYLMQMILHYRESGVSRDRLEEFLFGDRDINNAHHAMQSVIYNAKKRLKAAGLPDVNYIEQRKGIFYWTDKISVVEGAAEMERIYKEAEKTDHFEGKLNLYLDACHCYCGEFLPAQIGVIWVAQEAKRYRGLFCSSVEKAAAMLRNSQDYMRMEELGFYASRISPLSDWETVAMEALVSMGRYDEARKLYDDTVDFYFQEQGLKPSKKLMELMEKLGAKMEHSYEVLDSIQNKLSGRHGGFQGGYLCTYPVFQGIYHMAERLMERGGQSIYLMLCTIVDGKGNPMREGPQLEEHSQRLQEVIRRSVRHGDVINRYGKGQYLVLLINTTRENCKVIQKRINCGFMVGRQRTGVQYYVNSVVCTPDFQTDKEAQDGTGEE